jgi:hypothetical protein
MAIFFNQHKPRKCPNGALKIQINMCSSKLSYQLGSGFTLTTWYEKRRKTVFYRSFPAGARKPQRIETKCKGKRK